MSHRLHRRAFLQATSALVAALHVPLCGRLAAREPVAQEPRLRHVQLQTHKLDELRSFYHKKLGLSMPAETGQGFTLQAGPSSLQFTNAPGKTEPFYHFAFNIPENQFAAAKAWLAQRTPLLIDSSTKKDEVFFASWNAHAVYFRDPAGNIGELIARHPLKNGSTAPFSEASLLCVSEIGLVAQNSKTLANEVQQRLAWPKSGSEMAFVGDDMGYLIIAPAGRPWLPDRIQKAVMAPVEVKVDAALKEPLRWPALPFVIRGKS